MDVGLITVLGGLLVPAKLVLVPPSCVFSKSRDILMCLIQITASFPETTWLCCEESAHVFIILWCTAVFDLAVTQ